MTPSNPAPSAAPVPCDVVVIEREPLLKAMDELVHAVAKSWGRGSTQHNLVRDVADLIRRVPTTTVCFHGAHP